LDEIYKRGLQALNRYYSDEKKEKETMKVDEYIEPLKYHQPKRKKEK